MLKANLDNEICFSNVKPVLVFFPHKYLIQGWTLNKHTRVSFSTEVRLFLSLLLMCNKLEKACSHIEEVENCSNIFMAFLWMVGYSSFTETQNLSRDRSANLILSVQSSFSSFKINFSGWPENLDYESLTQSYTCVEREGK